MATEARIKYIIQKRTSLKGQITILKKGFDDKKLENANLKLRLNRLTELYNAFEEFNDELAILDPRDEHQIDFLNIQDNFYVLAGEIESALNPINTDTTLANASVALANETLNETNNVINQRRRIKLPETSLPSFDGKYENWLAFKHAFVSLIDSQADLSESDKLLYLKAALKGEAANKINVLAMDENNYTKAWDLLKKAYEVKRLLVSRHLHLLMNLPQQDKETSAGLMRLADDSQQHVLALKSLDVNIPSEILVHILEEKLNRNTLEKWEETLERDIFPTIEEMYEFIYKTAVRVSKRKGSEISNSSQDQKLPLKKKRVNNSARAFFTNTSKNCVVCKQNSHPLYKCKKFANMSIQDRIKVVKGNNLCFNCLRNHGKSECAYRLCPKCNKNHNSMLHIDDYQKNNSKPNISNERNKNNDTSSKSQTD